MALHDRAAVGDGKEKGFAPIETGVKADGVPEIARAIQGESKKEADQSDAGRTDRSFTRVAEVEGAEGQGEQNCGGPETDAVGECELCVAAEGKLLEEADGDEEQQVEEAP